MEPQNRLLLEKGPTQLHKRIAVNKSGLHRQFFYIQNTSVVNKSVTTCCIFLSPGFPPWRLCLGSAGCFRSRVSDPVSAGRGRRTQLTPGPAPAAHLAVGV